MNLFDNIIKSSVNKFLGTTTPSVPSFTTPQAPRTMNYTQPTAPVAQKPNMTLFSDEQKMFQKMKADNLPDETAFSMLKKRRMDILGGNDLANDEKTILLKMQADNVPVKQAVSMIQQRRKDQFEKKYQEGNLLQKGAYNTLAFAAGNLETLAKYSGNTLDFITGGTMGFGDEVKKMEQVTQSPEFSESSAFTAGTYAPDVALAVSPIGGGYLAGAKGMTGLQGAKLLSTQGAKNLSQGLMGRSAVVGAGFGGIQPILDKGSDATMKDIATSAAEGGAIGAVATPVIGKALKYGQAGYRGGLTGMGKSITRDVNAVKTGVQKGIQNRADIASTNINRMNAGQIRSFNDEIGVSPGKFLNDRGINDTGDTLVENLSKNLKLSRKAADDGLANIKGNFKAPTQEVATSTVDDTGKFVTKKVDPVETMLRDNLDNASSKGMSKESLRAKELLEKYQNEGLSMTEINEAKRFLNANNKFSYFSDDVSPRKGFVTNLDNEVRKWQFQTAEQQGFSNLKDINKDTKAYYKLLEGIGGWQDKIAGNNPMGLTDWLAFNADPTIFLAKQVAQSNIAKRTYLKGLNALSGRKVQPEIKKPTNLSKNGIPNSNNSNNVPSSKRIDVKAPVKVPKSEKPIVIPKIKPNESKISNTIPSDTIPEGYTKNAFGEIVKKPSNSKGGFIRNPFAKPEPKRLFAGENSAQPPKGKTGWFKGADGKMRFEIDDSGATVNKLGINLQNYIETSGNKLPTVGDILSHDELYKQYPAIKNIRLIVLEGKGMGTASLTELPNGKPAINLGGLMDEWGTKYNILHEIQHAIQTKEGFAKGGNDTNFNIYKSLAGEVEARNVSSRMDLTAKQRTIKSPESTEDVPRAKQIIRMEGGKAMSIPKTLIEEARKYKSAEEFIGDVIAQDYQISKNPGSRAFNVKVKLGGNRANELNNDSLKKIVEIAKINKTYDKEFQESVDSLLSNDSEVTIYRAAPIGKSINKNDYVTLSKNEADKYMRVSIFNPNKIREGYKIYEMKVKKEDLLQQGKNSMYFTYFPKSKESQLRKIYEQANSPKPIVKSVGDMETKKLIEEARKYKSAEELGIKIEKGGHLLDQLKSLNIDSAKIKSSLFGNEISFDKRDLLKQTTGKLRSNYWMEKIRNGERPVVLVDSMGGKLSVIDGNHKVSAYKALGIDNIPTIYTNNAKSQILDLF